MDDPSTSPTVIPVCSSAMIIPSVNSSLSVNEIRKPLHPEEVCGTQQIQENSQLKSKKKCNRAYAMSLLGSNPVIKAALPVAPADVSTRFEL